MINIWLFFFADNGNKPFKAIKTEIKIRIQTKNEQK